MSLGSSLALAFSAYMISVLASHTKKYSQSKNIF